jgi:hypothetical protein
MLPVAGRKQAEAHSAAKDGTVWQDFQITPDKSAVGETLIHGCQLFVPWFA